MRELESEQLLCTEIQISVTVSGYLKTQALSKHHTDKAHVVSIFLTNT